MPHLSWWLSGLDRIIGYKTVCCDCCTVHCVCQTLQATTVLFVCGIWIAKRASRRSHLTVRSLMSRFTMLHFIHRNLLLPVLVQTHWQKCLRDVCSAAVTMSVTSDDCHDATVHSCRGGDYRGDPNISPPWPHPPTIQKKSPPLHSCTVYTSLKFSCSMAAKPPLCLQCVHCTIM